MGLKKFIIPGIYSFLLLLGGMIGGVCLFILLLTRADFFTYLRMFSLLINDAAVNEFYERSRLLAIGGGIASSGWILFLVIFRQKIMRGITSWKTSLQEVLREYQTLTRTFWKTFATEKNALIVVVILSVLGITLRVHFLSSPIRYDEATTYMQFVRPGLSRLFYYPFPNNHVLHTLLVALSTACFGIQPWAIRLPAFVSGCLLIPASYLCCRILFAPSSGLLAAAMVACSPLMVLYSTNARGYTLLTLFTLLLFLLCHAFLNTRVKGTGFLFAMLAAFGFYTIPIMFFPLSIMVVWFVLATFTDKNSGTLKFLIQWLGKTLLLTGVLTIIMYIPVILRSGLESLFSNSFVQPLPLRELPTQWWLSAQNTWTFLYQGIPVSFQFLFLISALLGMWSLWQKKQRSFWLLISIPLGILIILGIKRVNPFLRTWIFLFPLWSCICDIGYTSLFYRYFSARKISLMVGIPVIFLTSIITIQLWLTDGISEYQSIGTFSDAEAITRFLHPMLKPSDIICAVCPASAPLQYYFLRYGLEPGQVRTQSSLHGRTYLVVDHPEHTVDDLLTACLRPVSQQVYYPLHSFSHTMLYVLQKNGK